MRRTLARWRAVWLATLVLTTGAAAQDPDAKTLAATCAPCHGDSGNAGEAGFPSLAGQPEFWLLDQLILMKVGVRNVPEMTSVLADLTEADFETLAAHFNALPAERTGPEPDPALVEEASALAQSRRCRSCHGPELAGREAIPRLADQRIDYLTAALAAYRDGTRRSADTNMTAAVRGLSDAELRALAHWASAQ